MSGLPGTKICPNCTEVLAGDAILCTHCGHRFAPIPALARSGFTPTPAVQKVGCGILVLAALAAMLWGFATLYQAQSPEAANAVAADRDR